MLSEEQLEIISEAIEPLFQYLEKEVIVDIARRIQKTLTYSRTAELQAMSMQKLGYSPSRIRKEAMKILNADKNFRKEVAKNTLEYKRDVRKIINEITREAYKANDDIISNAGNMAWVDDLSVWKQAGKELGYNSFLHQIVESFVIQTAGELKNLTQTAGFKGINGYESIENAYKRELDKAVIKICSGTFDQNKVLKDVVHELAHSGLRSIDFESGYSMQLDSAARLAIRTGCHQLSSKIHDKNILETGENLIYVSKHWGARNKGAGVENHELWQGQVYYIKPGTDYSEEAERIGQERIMDIWYSTGYSPDGLHVNNPLGLHGYNCRHQHYVWFEGISGFPKNHYEKAPGPVTINGKTYDYYAATQKMRSMERAVRALKREKEALKTLGMDTKEISVKISKKQREYREFCQMCGVPAKTTRMRYESGTSDLKKTNTWKDYESTIFRNDLKSKSLGASDEIVDGSEPVYIGDIDNEMKEEAIKYFGEQIRNSEIERLYVIDKNGRVYYNEGKESAVSTGGLDLTDCIVLHNHPKINGILSFGANDLDAIRNSGNSEWYLFNEEYSYYAKKLKSLDEISYNVYYRKALETAPIGEDYQHFVFRMLYEEGYIKYERTPVDRGKKG